MVLGFKLFKPRPEIQCPCYSIWLWDSPLALPWRVSGSRNGCGSGRIGVKDNPTPWPTDGQWLMPLLWTIEEQRHQWADKVSGGSDHKTESTFLHFRVQLETLRRHKWGVCIQWGGAANSRVVCWWSPGIQTEVCNSKALPLLRASGQHLDIECVGAIDESGKEKKMCCSRVPWDLMLIFL